MEDNPYREMRFVGTAPPPIIALDPDGRTVYLSTFSKTLAPGLRVGWLAGPEPIVSQCVTGKQAMDLCGPALTQAIVTGLLRRGTMFARLSGVVARYRQKCDVMLDALAREMPDGVRWTRPEGGLFLWVTLPEWVDAGELLWPAVEEERVAYVPGGSFYADGTGRNTMRLNFSYPSEKEIQEGIARLARLIRRRAPERAPQPVHTIHSRGTSVSD